MSAALSMVLVTGIAEARSLQKDTGPAEQPPATYTGKQYVDSRGCVYIRAGYAGLVEWVPRVTRDRQVVCGQTPTFAKKKPKAAEQPRVAEQPKPAAKPKVKKATVAATPTPAAKPKAKAKPAAVAAAPAKPQLPSDAQAMARAERGDACNGAPILSARYLDSKRIGVRCGKVAAPVAVAVAKPVKPVPTARPATTSVASVPTARPVVPRTTVRNAGTAAPLRLTVTQPRTAAITIPEGYEPAWSDDRLNPQRGKGTAAGQAAMDLLWTQTVPRKLIDVTTGQDVTRRLSHLDYPYTDYSEQRVDLGLAPVPAAKSQLSTKAQPQGNRFIQVALFGQPSNTRAAVAKLQALGLPVTLKKKTSKGRVLEQLMAGPLTDAAVAQALAQIKRAGFRDAYLR
ncbi:SPOR domain-containing protein [Actibacterium mucosum]|uniref:SPOR domain-containing protein n=1 Tax=Actibacterium mucosum TaxID=1087332 RepID=UPI0012690970|nr:SPOR domain-containing protein [Actibacterium mucosum]